VYCVLAQSSVYVPPYIIKVSSMVYVYPENRDPTDFGMRPPEGLIRPWLTDGHARDSGTRGSVDCNFVILSIEKNCFSGLQRRIEF